MKKILRCFLVSIFLFSICTSVNAESDSAFYTNSNGVDLTQDEYNYLINYFSESTLYSMTKEQLNYLKTQTNLTISTETKYIKTDEYYDRLGNLIEIVEKEVTEEEALNFEDDSTSYSWNTTHTTSMKKLYMQVVSGSASTKIVTLTNTWLSLPSVRSYDVIALRPDTTSSTISVNSSTISGYQKWDGNTISYSSSSSNTKVSSSFNGSGGIGISMNIVDDVSSSLENSITVYFLCGASTFKIAGTYQHATSTVTLAQSQNYTFSSSGLGGVLNFSSSVSSKYDGMKGVYLTYYYADELL